MADETNVFPWRRQPLEQQAQSIQRSKRNGNIFRYPHLLLLFFLPYTSLPRFPDFTGAISLLPTWRYVTIGFVILGAIRIAGSKFKKRRLPIFFILGVSFVSLLILQQIISESDQVVRSVATILGVMFLVGLVGVLYWMLRVEFWTVIQILSFSATVAVLYQLFQVCAVLILGNRELAVLFNDAKSVEISNFFRMIGSWFGAPSFYTESGHLALFLGPWAMCRLLIWRFFGGKLPTPILFVCIAGLGITASAGGAVEIGFFLLTLGGILIFGASRKLKIRVVAVTGCILPIVAGVSFMKFDGLSLADFFFKKYELWLMGDTPRQIGAQQMMATFYKYPLTGVGLGDAVNDYSIDPNMFVPNLLATHGIIVAIAFFVYLVAPFFTTVRSTAQLLCMIPMAAITFHMANAYGTYTWPHIWIIYTVTLFLVHAVKPGKP